MARVEPTHYVGKVWCVRVPSGAFVARRNGKVFVTGNSGFPKGLDVSRKIDEMGATNIGWFGPWLRQERERRGLTQKELARHFPSKSGGLTGCVANWELGLNAPTVEQFNKLCDVLGLPFERLEEAEREVVGKSPNGFGPNKGASLTHAMEAHPDVTAPATEEAKKWSGFNVALKPAWEVILVFRRPLAESSVARQVLATGTGAMNIGATRVGGSSRPLRISGSEESANLYGDGLNGSRAAGTTNVGRYPSNLLLSHIPPDENGEGGCVRTGTKRVRNDTGGAFGGNPSEGYHGFKERHTREHYKDPDGTEEVEEYICQPGCPVAEIDRQSGVRKSGSGNKNGGASRRWLGNTGFKPHDGPSTGGDEGGASRYFACFDGEPGMFYAAKSSRQERNAGLEMLPKAQRKTMAGDRLISEGRTAARGTAVVQNTHSTVKPLKLMRYLVKLVTPPDGVVLDPFAGSGTTLCAAVDEGFGAVGIEKDTEEGYVEIAKARIAHHQRLKALEPLSLFGEDA